MAYLDLARALPEAKFWMVGVPPSDSQQDPLVDRVLSAATELRNLDLLPPRSHAELGKLMDQAVASVNTATFEGMPNVLLEAWARGIPALVLHYDPAGVITRWGLGGFADGSVEKLVDLARLLWQTRHDRDDVASRCREYMRVNHAPETIAAQWLTPLGITEGSLVSGESYAAREGGMAGEGVSFTGD